jgi:site-specific recombinase XerD
MSKQSKFTPTKTDKGWRISIPPKHSPSGKRERHFYKTQRQALDASKKLKDSAVEFGEQARAIKPSMAEDASAAAALLEPWGASLIEAARLYVKIRAEEAASKPTSEALDLWIADMEGRELRGRTVTNYKQTRKRFDILGKKMLSSVTRSELQDIVSPAGMTVSTAAGHFRNGLAFWNWAARREWCDAAVFTKLDRPAKRQRKRIEFLSPEDATALLGTAIEFFPQAVGHFAVMLFAGVRPDETGRLEPEHVATTGIEIGADHAKGRSRRFINPDATLAAWLQKHPFQNVTDWNRIYIATRRLAGWAVKSELADKLVETKRIEKLPPASRGKWPHDGTRHSCATYHIARGGDLENMAYWFGHSGGTRTLRNHYVGSATKKQALEFFAIVPAGTAPPAVIAPVEDTRAAS